MPIFIGLTIDMILYFVLKWVYGTPVSLTVSEVQIIITLHNNNILPINCCRGNKQLFDIKYIFCALRPLGNFGFCRMKLHIPATGHGPRLILVRLWIHISAGRAWWRHRSFHVLLPEWSFYSLQVFCLITSAGILKIEVSFIKIYIYYPECPVLTSSISHGFFSSSGFVSNVMIFLTLF